MKLYGYTDEARSAENAVPAELVEISLVAAPDELRRIAQFLEACASNMEARGGKWEHEHLADKDRSFSGSPHFIVFNPEFGQCR